MNYDENNGGDGGLGCGRSELSNNILNIDNTNHSTSSSAIKLNKNKQRLKITIKNQTSFESNNSSSFEFGHSGSESGGGGGGIGGGDRSRHFSSTTISTTDSINPVVGRRGSFSSGGGDGDDIENSTNNNKNKSLSSTAFINSNSGSSGGGGGGANVSFGPNQDMKNNKINNLISVSDDNSIAINFGGDNNFNLNNLQNILPTFIQNEQKDSSINSDLGNISNNSSRTAIISRKIKFNDKLTVPTTRIHSSPAKALRRYSQDNSISNSAAAVVHRNKSINLNRSDPLLRHQQQTETDDQKLQMSPSLNEEDDVTNESTLLKIPTIERWIESQNHHLNETFLENSEAFGSKVNPENIPGTPMEPDDFLVNNEKLFDQLNLPSATINEITERRRRSSLDSRAINKIQRDLSSTSPQSPPPPPPPPLQTLEMIEQINNIDNGGSDIGIGDGTGSGNTSTNNSTINLNSGSAAIINNNNNSKTSIRNSNFMNNNNNNNNHFKENHLNSTTLVGTQNRKRSSLGLSDATGGGGGGDSGSGDGGSDSRKNSKQDKEGIDPESLMFRDCRRKIDIVLSYEEENEGVMTEIESRRRENRQRFLENLVKEGLELETEDKSQAFDEKTYFVKVHLPWKTETRLAEVLNIKLPVKRFITISVKAWDDDKTSVLKYGYFRRWLRKFRKLIELDPLLAETEATFYSATAGGNPEEQFIVKDRCTSYTSAQRSSIVWQILLRTKFDDTEKSGIRRLINDGTFVAVFPLHEGRYDIPHSSGTTFDRRILYLEWARPGKWYKKQPLCLIRKYFGDKIALYFCWLGFYTNMLVYPAVVGTICFLYGVVSMNSDDNTPSAEICDPKIAGNIVLCPLCDKACDYQTLSDSCLFARMTYLFDNPSTVFFAIFMSFWATTFLELWKRKQSVIIWEWDLQSIESDEENRPEFEASVKTFRTNPVTREKEPYMPTWTRASRYLITFGVVLFMICIVLGAVLGTIIYRISVLSAVYAGGNTFIRKHAKIFTTITAATINLIIIMILTRIYHKVAIRLTNMENPRTHTEYEDSYTFKIFFFEFMNFYSSLIYIAFFKGRFFDYPGDDVARKSEFYRLKGDICDPAGCLSELCIQLAIIMVGKQCWNNCMEYLFPVFWNWWRQRKHKKQTKDETHLHMAWEQDYHMQDPGRLALFDEYLEMILQYGFVTLFVAAFPLAPLFALINNVAEIRLDAFKMVTQARRPLAERVEDIGAWYGILRIITYVAVVSNAFVIAYTSDYIPRMVYKYVYSNDNTLTGYIDHSLSDFNTSDYQKDWFISTSYSKAIPPNCQYRGYRNGPNHDDRYGLSPHYWHVFAARLAFVVVFEHVVFVLTGIMQFIIPDIPTEVKTQIQREQLLAKEAKYQHGLKKSQENDYNDLLQNIRDQNTSSRQGVRGSFLRRLSRISDGLDAHVEISGKPKRRSMESTVWEVMEKSATGTAGCEKPPPPAPPPEQSE